MDNRKNDKEFCTNSVLQFLKENKYLVEEYIEKATLLGEPISYSGMLRLTVDGDTRDGVKLRSRMVERVKVTKYIEEVANEQKRRDLRRRKG